MTYTSALPLALIQLEVPPANVVSEIGEQPRWFIDALNLQPDEYLIVRPHLGEALPAFDQISGAILSGSWRWSPITLNGANAAPYGFAQRWITACRCWGSATVTS